jgi:hypothetical protein
MIFFGNSIGDSFNTSVLRIIPEDIYKNQQNTSNIHYRVIRSPYGEDVSKMFIMDMRLTYGWRAMWKGIAVAMFMQKLDLIDSKGVRTNEDVIVTNGKYMFGGGPYSRAVDYDCTGNYEGGVLELYAY